MRSLVERHLRDRVPGRVREHEHWKALSDVVALERALQGQDACGRKHDHQYRVPLVALRTAAQLAAERWDDFFEPDTFEPIIAATRRIQSVVRSLGQMWGYDAAERIAAHRGIVPDAFVYVQRGALQGARRLGLRVVKGRIRYASLPASLRMLSAADVEDFLCVNKDRLAIAMLSE